MKNKVLAFYVISALCLGLFMLLPMATGYTFDGDFPGLAFCQEWIGAGERFAIYGN